MTCVVQIVLLLIKLLIGIIDFTISFVNKFSNGGKNDEGEYSKDENNFEDKTDVDDGEIFKIGNLLNNSIFEELENRYYNNSSSNLSDSSNPSQNIFTSLKSNSYENWHTQSNGMEFASELLITALKAKAKIVEIKGGLRRDLRSRAPHLKTWRDGMRHLLFILSEKPEFFDSVGFIGLLLTVILSAITLIVGPTAYGNVHIFDIHTKLFLIAGSILFMQLYQVGCYLYTMSDTRPFLWLTRKVLNWEEANIFFVLFLSFVLEAVGVITIIVSWYQSNFHDLAQSGLLFGLIQALVLVGSFMIGLLTNAILKQYLRRMH